MSTWTRRARLFVGRRAFLLDLGEEVLFYAGGAVRRCPLEVAPLAFEWAGETLVLPGLRVYLGGPPEFVETPYYAWPLTGPRGRE